MKSGIGKSNFWIEPNYNICSKLQIYFIWIELNCFCGLNIPNSPTSLKSQGHIWELFYELYQPSMPLVQLVLAFQKM